MEQLGGEHREHGHREPAQRVAYGRGTGHVDFGGRLRGRRLPLRVRRRIRAGVRARVRGAGHASPPRLTPGFFRELLPVPHFFMILAYVPLSISSPIASTSTFRSGEPFGTTAPW